MHGAEFVTIDGWDFIRCMCGWTTPPSPDKAIAADFYADHRIAVALDDTPDA